MSDDFNEKENEASPTKSAQDKAKEALGAGKEKLAAGTGKVHEKIKGLAFRGMLEKKVSPETRAKFPVLDKLIPLTNYIVCILAVVIVVLVVRGIAGVGGGGSSGGGSVTVGGTRISVGRAAPASDFTCVLSDDGKGVVIRQYTGNGGALVILSEIEGFPVVELASRAFYGEDDRSFGPGYNITSVVIPASVKKIGGSCFRQIENLISVTIQGTGVMFENNVFYRSLNLETLNIPNGDNVLIAWRSPNWSANEKNDSFTGCIKLPLAMRARLVAMGFREP